MELDQYIKLDEEACKATNLCNRFTERDLQKIGGWVFDGYERDKKSRFKWERRTQAAMDLAMQVTKDKSFPWPNASNIAFPLVTIATLQFHSRAYPAIISGPDVVKCRIFGEDPMGSKKARALRISTHMSWQCLEQDQSWEEQKDRLLINLPIVGTTFTKSFYDADLGYKRDETVLAQDLVLDYYSKSVESSPRKTHIIPMYRNDIRSRILRKVYRDVSEESWYGHAPVSNLDQSANDRNNRIGLQVPEGDETTPFIGLEQHVNLDLDNDGYAEPYIITIEESSHCVLRIVTGFDDWNAVEVTKNGEIISIQPIQYFTKYELIPSPDGGVYGVGFGILLGPLNEATNSLINQLVDAGTMSVAAGGFLGKGAKIRGGVYTFAPLEWKRVDSSGDDLRKNIVPLDVREPSAVLFQLLNLLITYVQRISGTTDPMVGESTGQNTPAETSRSMITEGMKIYSAVYKRIWRSMKEEFKKDYILNGLYLPIRQGFGVEGMAKRDDYLGNPDEIAPAADPNVTSDAMQMQQALTLKQAAASTPGYDPEQVERRFLKAMKIDNIDQIYPGIAKTGAPKDVKLQIAELKAQADNGWLQFELHKTSAELMEQQRLNNAEIARIVAEIEDMKATQVGDQADRQINFLNTMLGVMKSRNDALSMRIDSALRLMEMNGQVSGDSGAMGGLAAAPGDGGSAAESLAQSEATA